MFSGWESYRQNLWEMGGSWYVVWGGGIIAEVEEIERATEGITGTML